MWAAAEGNVAAIKVLLEAGADINARTAAAGPAAGGRGGRPAPNGGGVFTGAVGGAEPAAAATGRPSFTAMLFAVQLGRLEAVNRPISEAEATGARVIQLRDDDMSSRASSTSMRITT